MAQGPRGNWLPASGLTRQEQRVLVFLIVVVGVGLGYQHYQGNWRRETLALHRAGPSTGNPGAGAGQPGSPPAAQPTPRGPLDLNKATAQELETLPGIGSVRAETIVRSRQVQGPYRSLDDLKRIPGIGDRTVEGLRAYVVAPQGQSDTTSATAQRQPPIAAAPLPTPSPEGVDGSGRIDLNTAGEEGLCSLDGIGTVLARRIIEFRRTHGPFRTIADIQKVSGIGPRTYEKNRHRITVGRREGGRRETPGR